MDDLGKVLYEMFCSTADKYKPLPWDDLSPEVQDAWRKTASSYGDWIRS
jgi:hypothetical protein